MNRAPASGGMVVAPHYLAAQAGEDVLAEGGNAIEAMIASAAAIAVVYFVVTGAIQFVHSYQLGQEEDRAEADVRDFQERFHRLEALRDYLNSDKFIEAAAREQLGLRRPGEANIVVISSEPAPATEEGEPDQELWWESLLSR